MPQPPAKAVEAPPRNDLQVAEDSVRRQLGNRAGGRLRQCSRLSRRPHRHRLRRGDPRRAPRALHRVDGRGAWLESEMRPGEMDRAVREFCSRRAAAQGSALMSAIIGVILAVLAIFVLIKVVGLIFKIIAVADPRRRASSAAWLWIRKTVEGDEQGRALPDPRGRHRRRLASCCSACCCCRRSASKAWR